MGEIKLKALECLWCHSDDITHERTSRTRSQMVCADCGAAGPAVYGEKPIDGDDPTEAITAWNTRTPLEVDEGAIDRAALALGRAQYQRGDAEAVFMSWFPRSIEMEQCRKDARTALPAAFGGKTDA